MGVPVLGSCGGKGAAVVGLFVVIGNCRRLPLSSRGTKGAGLAISINGTAVILPFCNTPIR